MESQPQNPEFRINPENFHPFKGADQPVWVCRLVCTFVDNIQNKQHNGQ